jgi:O-6-methylguanine DNA methyltransferase
MTDSLLADLAALGASPPAGFADAVFADYVQLDAVAALPAVFVAFTDQGICCVDPSREEGEFLDRFHRRFGRPLRFARRAPRGVVDALRSGRSAALRYDLRGLSEFEQAVLRKTLEIPRGEVRPYAWVAREIGNPAAVRATGSALGRNPIPFLIPCHRVIRSDGTPGQYGFGPELKKKLLTAEGYVTGV